MHFLAVNGPRSISKATRIRVFRRDMYTCRYCGGQPPDVRLVIDHIIPVARGGSAHESNLATACHDCNSGKYTQPILPLDRILFSEDIEEGMANEYAALLFPLLGILPMPCGIDEPPPADPGDVAWLRKHCGPDPVCVEAA
jgi:hypothetical protein